MGMFDYIKCDYPLPQSRVQGNVFQTKDFDSNMDSYLITQDGKLQKTSGNWFGRKIENGDYKDVPYNGVINFYELLVFNTEFKQWYEYSATFVDGWLVDLEVIDDGTKRFI